MLLSNAIDISCNFLIMDNSPLNKLPSELLNRIAELALYHQEGVIIANNKKRSVEPAALLTQNNHTKAMIQNMKTHAFTKTAHAAALTQTCKQMRKDHKKLYHSCNNFTLGTVDRTLEEDTLALEQAIGPELAKLMGPMRVILNVFELGYHGFYLEPAFRDLSWSQKVSYRKKAISELVLRLILHDRTFFKVISLSTESVRKSLVEEAITAFDEGYGCICYRQSLHMHADGR